MTLNEILVTKMSHDLAGFVGALDNMADLILMDESFVKEGGKVIKETTVKLIARLKFFRALLGLETKIDFELASSYLKTLSNHIHLEGDVNKKIHLIFTLLASEILIDGGSLQVSDEGFVCMGKIFISDEKKFLLLARETNLSVENVFLIYLNHWMIENKLKADIYQADDVFSLRFLSETL